MVYKKGTPEYDRWRRSPEYDLWRVRKSMAMLGKRNHNYGKSPSAETRWKISMAQKGQPKLALRDRPLSEEHRQSISMALKGKKHSEETKQKISASLMGRLRPDLNGPNNPNWRGGVSFEPYPVGWNDHLREIIRKRDNYTCVLCGKMQITQRHSVHHINYDKKDLRPTNLMTLCTGCHRKTNTNREYWENLFKIVYVPNFPT